MRSTYAKVRLLMDLINFTSMPLRCVAIDDEPPALILLREYISRFPSLQLVQTFDDAISGSEFVRNNPVDLLFIDINMPDITGLDIVRSLPSKPMVIFTTAHRKYAVEGFELDAIDYLLKPISLERFTKAVNKALEYYEYREKPVVNPGNGHLFVYSEYRMIKISLDEIEYIESMEDYIKIHLTNSKPVLTLMTMKAVLEKLPAARFKRIHRSHIISTDKIRSVLNRKVKLASGTELAVSDSYSDFIKEWKAGE